MSRCDDAVEKVYFYLDEEMTWYRRRRIRRHLKRCTNCDGAYSFEAHFIEVVRRKAREEPPPEQMEELIGRLRALLHEHGSDEVQA